MSRQVTHKKTTDPNTYKKMVSLTDNKKNVTEILFLLIGIVTLKV